MISTLLGWCLALSAIFQIGILIFIYRHLLPGMKSLTISCPNEAEEKPKVSVVICAKNEAANLSQYLPLVLNQQYFTHNIHDFEVIVVNDCSNDATAAVLNDFKKENLHLKVITLSPDLIRNFPGKKFALSQGVHAAKFPIIAAIDADCFPVSQNWLNHLSEPFINGKQIVAGYGAYVPEKGLLNLFIRYETIQTFISLYSFAAAGFPYMAVGRNIAFTKEIFVSAENHPNWKKVPSGDDDLLVSLCGNRKNFSALTHPESYTYSRAPSNLKKYFLQKQRHVSTGKYYPMTIKILVGGFAFSIALYWLSLLLIGITSATSLPVLIGSSVPLFTYSILLTVNARRLGTRSNLGYWLLFLFCWTIYNAVLAPYILWKNKMRWK